MHPILIRCLLIAVLLAAVAHPACAQVVSLPGVVTHPAAVTGPPAAPALTPAEAREMLDLLNDPQKRAAFTATLQTLTKATAAISPPKPASTVPLAPDSLGAQILNESSSWLANLSHQAVSFGRVLGDLPAVWVFTLHTMNDPALRATALDAAWRLAAVLFAAALAEWAVDRLLRRPVRAIARAASDNTDPALAGPPDAIEGSARVQARVLEREGMATEADSAPPAVFDEAADLPHADVIGEAAATPEDAAVEHVLRRRRFARTLRALKRLPFVFLCFILDVMPLGIFLGVAYAGTLLCTAHVQAVLQAAIMAYAVCRLATCVTRMFVSPDHPSLRLMHVSDEGAAYVLVWVRRIFAVGAFGVAASQMGALFGLPQPANDAFLKAVILVDHLFLIVIVLQCRRSIADRIKSHREKPGFSGIIRNRIAAIWHLIAIFYIGGTWLVWAAEIRNGYLRIWHCFSGQCRRGDRRAAGRDCRARRAGSPVPRVAGNEQPLSGAGTPRPTAITRCCAARSRAFSLLSARWLCCRPGGSTRWPGSARTRWAASWSPRHSPCWWRGRSRWRFGRR